MRPSVFLVVCALSLPFRSGAQAPATGPLALLMPASTRAMALGNAGVTGRDDDVLFYNPAQLINVRGGFNMSVARYGNASTLGAVSSSFTGGPLSLGWGVQTVDYSTSATGPYPFVPAVLADRGDAHASSLLAAVGGAMTFKGFRIGAAGKYAEDRVSGGGAAGTGIAPALHGVFVGDVGVSHNLWTGIAGLSIQNIGRRAEETASHLNVPLEASLGWSATKQVGELDVGVATQVTARKGWITPGGGVEVGYSWIEGYAVTLRAGARRPETSAEHPFALGAAFNADRLTLEYALQFFDGGHSANRMTFRWR
jgi:hypothetical protein